jgi:hypothetical protein
MNATDALEARRRRYVLCEFRHVLVWAKLAQVDIETAVLALDRNLVTAEQALAMFWCSPAVCLLGLDFPEASQTAPRGLSCQHEVRA